MDVDNMANVPTSLQPVDLSVWCEYEGKACAIHHANVDTLKATAEKEWAHTSMDLFLHLQAIQAQDGGRDEGQWWPQRKLNTYDLNKLITLYLSTSFTLSYSWWSLTWCNFFTFCPCSL